MRTRIPVLGLLAAGCTAAPPAGPSERDWSALYPELAADAEPAAPAGEARPAGLFAARRPDRECRTRLDAAIRTYVEDGDDAFASQRDELASDPVAAFWLTRALVLFVVTARDAAPAVEEVLVAEPAWERPSRQIAAMGAAAVPCVVLDLVRNQRGDRLHIGAELLQRIGAPGLTRWQPVLRFEDPVLRRSLVEAVAGFEELSPPAVDELERAARDADFGVRAAAWRGLGRDPASIPRLAAALATETDPFVRRALVETLARHPTRGAASALVDHLQRCTERGDRDGALAADGALRKMSGRTRRADPATWRAWVDTLPSDG
jgi:hypothetical protein